MLALGVGSASLLVVTAEYSIPVFLQRLGDASYGIYLVHVPVMIAIFPSAGPVWLAITSLVFGALYGLFVRLYGLLVNKQAIAPPVHVVSKPTLF
jgi:peptidoglycan/LPS O-acetylase OafA/YrhL